MSVPLTTGGCPAGPRYQDRRPRSSTWDVAILGEGEPGCTGEHLSGLGIERLPARCSSVGIVKGYVLGVHLRDGSGPELLIALVEHVEQVPVHQRVDRVFHGSNSVSRLTRPAAPLTDPGAPWRGEPSRPPLVRRIGQVTASRRRSCSGVLRSVQERCDRRSADRSARPASVHRQAVRAAADRSAGPRTPPIALADRAVIGHGDSELPPEAVTQVRTTAPTRKV